MLLRLLSRLLAGRNARLNRRLEQFFHQPPQELPIVNRGFHASELPNLHLAVERFAQQTAAARETLGYTSMMGGFNNSLRALLDPGPFMATHIGPVQFREVDVDIDRSVRCVENGIHLLDSQDGRVAVHVRFDMMSRGVELEVMAQDEEWAGEVLDRLKEDASRESIYRCKTLSLEAQTEEHGMGTCAGILFHRLAPVAADEIVLPEAVKKVLERNTVGFFRHAQALRNSGRSVRRGILLHGKPGTGKTLTARWLSQELEGVTTILVSGEQLGMVKECCRLARMLAPTVVILEDVDLIAAERDEMRGPGAQVALHQLLNEMDGLDPSAEVVFLLTTNRPQVLEQAIIGRPGRIDQAIEFPLPDPECRRRLLELYGRGLTVELEDVEDVVSRTHGASPAFIQELMRKAALIAAERNSYDGSRLRVTDGEIQEALQELVLRSGSLTRTFLGFAPPEP